MEKTLPKADVFSCPGCGAKLAFNPSEQLLHCPYCNNKIDIGKSPDDIREYDFAAAGDLPADWGAAAETIKCESCGAEIVLDNDSAAQFCVFCGSSHVVRNNNVMAIAPESVIPFKITEKQAMESFSTWIKKRWFSPGKLKTNYKTQKLSGVYVPCWTYDAITDSTYTAQAGDHYYENVTRWVVENGQNKAVTERVRKTRWRNVSGSCRYSFDDVVVNASNKIDQDLFEKTGAFDLSELVHYRPEFLAGFLAQRYSVDLHEGWEKAKSTIEAEIETRIKDSISADEVRYLNTDTTYYNVKYKHILLPQWISSYAYKNKIYRFIVNGQTGTVGGQAPLSIFKVFGVVMGSVLAGACVIGIILALLSR